MNKLLSFALVGHLECVKRAGSSHLELCGLLAIFLDGDSNNVLSAGKLQKLLDVGEFSRHCFGCLVRLAGYAI